MDQHLGLLDSISRASIGIEKDVDKKFSTIKDTPKEDKPLNDKPIQKCNVGRVPLVKWIEDDILWALHL